MAKPTKEDLDRTEAAIQKMQRENGPIIAASYDEQGVQWQPEAKR